MRRSASWSRWIIGWDLMLEYGLATSAVSVGWSGYLQSPLSGFGISLPMALTAAPGAVPGHFTAVQPARVSRDDGDHGAVLGRHQGVDARRST